MSIDYPPKLKLAQLPTPIQKLERLSKDLGTNIWVKRDDLTGLLASGNKVRKLEFSFAKAKQKGADTLITCGGVQSNHCRATAVLGAQCGFDVHLALRGEAPASIDGNLFIDHLAGAKISHFSPRYYNLHMDFIMQELCDEYREKNKTPYFIPTGASDGTGVWGYVRAVEEIANQQIEMNVEFDQIVSATGSGGTQAGLTAGVALQNMSAEVWGMAVCDDVNYFKNKVKADLLDWQREYRMGIDIEALPIHVNDQYIGQGYARTQPEVFRQIEETIRSEGIGLDPVYSGKAFYGMLNEIREGRFLGENILFIHTGGFFGLFGQRQQYFAQR